MSAGLICKQHVLDGRGNQFCLVPAIVVIHGIAVICSPTARRVGQEVVDSDVRDVRLERSLAVLCAEYPRSTEDLVIEIEFARLYEREDS